MNLTWIEATLIYLSSKTNWVCGIRFLFHLFLGNDKGQNQQLIFFSSPGHDVPITVELIKKTPRVAKASIRCSTADDGSFHPNDMDEHDEEV
jgi:hypothetical protein